MISRGTPISLNSQHPLPGGRKLTMAQIEANKALVRRFLKDFDTRGVRQALHNNASPDIVVHYPRGLSPEPLPRDAYEAAAGQISAAFPDLRHIIADVIAEGDMVCVRGTDYGTHRGPFLGVAPTGKDVAFTFMLVARVEDGKIAEAWAEADIIGLLLQLGAQPFPAGETTA